MGKKLKETKDKDYKSLKIASFLAAIASFAVYWAVGMVNSLYDISSFRSQYSLMLLGSAVFSLVCFVICIAAASKIEKRRYIYVFYTAVVSIITVLEFISAIFIKSYTSF